MAAVAALPPVAAGLPSLGSQSQSKTRKRKATDADIVDEKPRGRPRKNSKDESAAERRRTQIRLAQRAYRQRKETTIDELRQRVTELSTAVEMMDRGMRDFANSARQRGLPTQTAAELAALLESFIPHVSSVRSPLKYTAQSNNADNDDPASFGNPPSDPRMDPRNNGFRNMDVQVPAKLEHMPANLGYPMMLDNAMGLEQQDPLLPNSAQRQAGFVLEEEQYEESRQNPPQIYMQTQHTPGPAQQQPPHGQQPMPGQHSKPVLSMLNTNLYASAVLGRPRTVTPITANCNYEKSFARRLQRICIEAGYQLLVDPSKAPNAFQHVFRLHLSTGRDRNDVLNRFALAIKRDINDNLDSDVSPFSYIGGAGLHYPDTAGCRRPETGSSEDRAALDVMASSIPGLGGEWLDTNDVQGYLHERGIKVDGSAMYVHANMPVEFLSTPPERTEVDGFLSEVGRFHNFEDVEEFHTRFMALDDHLTSRSPLSPHGRVQGPPAPESFHMSALGNMWNSASVNNLELGSLTDLMNTTAPHFFSIPGTASYDAMQDYMNHTTHTNSMGPAPAPSSHRSSSSTAGSESNTFSPPMGEADSVSSADPDDASSPFEQRFHAHNQHNPRSVPSSYPGKMATAGPTAPASSQAQQTPFTPTSATPISPSSNRMPGVGANNTAPSSPGERVTVTIDVCKLMKILLMASVCLGRAPGFRRWHIDAAIRASIMTGF